MFLCSDEDVLYKKKNNYVAVNLIIRNIIVLCRNKQIVYSHAS